MRRQYPSNYGRLWIVRSPDLLFGNAVAKAQKLGFAPQSAGSSSAAYYALQLIFAGSAALACREQVAAASVSWACPLRRESQCNNGLHRGLCDYTHIQVYWPELPLPCRLIELICKGKCHPHKALGVMAVPFTPYTTP